MKCARATNNAGSVEGGGNGTHQLLDNLASDLTTTSTPANGTNFFFLFTKPGNKVKFRAIVVSPKLKPSVIGSIDVDVKDGAGNVVKKWERVFTTQGVFAGEFDLVKLCSYDLFKSSGGRVLDHRSANAKFRIFCFKKNENLAPPSKIDCILILSLIFQLFKMQRDLPSLKIC